MIKFFRRIRQRLLSENKFSKYLIYAFGEIVLVVIGILIALQINNWNEKRKQTELGYQYLTEMRYEVQADVSMINAYISRLKKSIENHKAALNTKDINTLPLDSLYMLVNPENLDFKVSELTHNKMNYLGISKLSNNDHLNTMITNYYNKQVVGLKLSLAFLVEELKKYTDYFAYQQDYFDLNSIDKYPSLINKTKDEHYNLNKLGLIKFATSVRGRNLIIYDLENKQYALTVLESFQAATVSLLNSVYDELKNQNTNIDPLPELPQEYLFKVIELPEDVLKQYVGRYELTQDTYILIELENKKLLLSYRSTNGGDFTKLDITPYEKDKFFIPEFFQQVFFKREKGEVKSADFNQDGENEFIKIN